MVLPGGIDIICKDDCWRSFRCHRKCVAQIPQALIRTKILLRRCLPGTDQQRFIHGKFCQTSETHRQLSCLVKTAGAQSCRVDRHRHQHRFFMAFKEIAVPPRDGFRIKIQIFPPVLYLTAAMDF